MIIYHIQYICIYIWAITGAIAVNIGISIMLKCTNLQFVEHFISKNIFQVTISQIVAHHFVFQARLSSVHLTYPAYIYSNSAPLSPPHWPCLKQIRPPSWPRVAVASSIQNTKLFTWRLYGVPKGVKHNHGALWLITDPHNSIMELNN